MFHAYIIPIATCFIYTLYGFCAFSGTNLLTRCHSASSCFLLFLVSEKLLWKYSRNWTKQKAMFLFFPKRYRVRRRDEGGRGGSHTMWWCGSPSGRATMWCGPLGRPPTSLFRPYNAPDMKTLKQLAFSREEFHCAAAIEDKFRGTKVSVPAPCRDEELQPESSPSTPPPSSSPLLTLMMRRE